MIRRVRGMPVAKIIIHCARRLTLCWKGDSEARIMCKVDLTNAFNSVSRSTIPGTIAKFSTLQGYLRNAYGGHTTLYYANSKLSSEEGFQQGDPLGPPGFCVGAAEAMSGSPSVDFEAWDMDDLTIGGTPAQVEEYLVFMVDKLRAIKLEVNWAKTEVVKNARALDQDLSGFALLSRAQKASSMDGWICLGAAIGTQQFVDEHATRIVQKGINRQKAIEKMGNNHAALALLRHTASVGLVNYEMRTAPVSQQVLDPFDSSLNETARRLLGLDDGQVSKFVAQAPFRHGGFGFRKSAAVAPCALLASALAADELAASLTPLALPMDPVLGVACSRMTPQPVADFSADLVTNDPRRRKVQKELTARVEDHQLEVATLILPDRVKAALSSAAAAADWSNPFPNEFFNSFLSNEQVQVLARMRCGLPVAPQPVPCRLCNGRATADVMGDHSAVCKGLGVRILLHNRLRDAFFNIASSALLTAQREQHPFPDAPNRRLDIVLNDLVADGRATAVDVAITHALNSEEAIAFAASAPGAWATRYEGVKKAEYEQMAEAAGVHLVPFIYDTLGARGESSGPTIRRLAGCWGNRFGIVFEEAMQLTARRMALVVAKGVADIVLANARTA